MTKKILDTSIYIDLFINPNLYEDIFTSEGPVYLSSVVLMELLAGAHTKNEKKKVNNLIALFRKLGRIITPSVKDYERAGELLLRLQRIKRYTLKKYYSITNDCLIAATARSMGATIFTQNKRDFRAIQDIFDVRIVFV